MLRQSNLPATDPRSPTSLASWPSIKSTVHNAIRTTTTYPNTIHNQPAHLNQTLTPSRRLYNNHTNRRIYNVTYVFSGLTRKLSGPFGRLGSICRGLVSLRECTMNTAKRLGLADEHIIARQRQRAQLCGLQLRRLHAFRSATGGPWARTPHLMVGWS